MTHLFRRLLLAALLVLAARPALAQPGTDPALCGSCTTPALTRDFLRLQWYTNVTRTISSYSTSRSRMYTNVFVQNDSVECVYTGFKMRRILSGTTLEPINCEHTIPQSYFAEAEPMRSDIHHLFPTHGSVNSARSNYPVGNVVDNEAETWYTALNNVYTTRSTPPTANPQRFSKLNGQGANAPLFEPRDDHKGDIARAIFYYYTVYPNTAGGTGAGGIRRVANPATLYQWHLQDPVDQKELDKNNRIAAFQGTRNFFIDFPNSVLQAWGDEIGSVTASITPTLPKTSFFVGESFTLIYSAAGAYTSGNVFTAQLSDAAGSFASPTVLGTVSRTSSGSISCTIPASVTTAGAGYLIRVVSSAPVVTGSNSAAVTIALTPPATGLTLAPLGFTTLEQGQAFTVSYTTAGIFNTGNSFTVYIKSAAFNANDGDGIPVGNVVSTSSGSIACAIPSGLAVNGSYRVRIVASNTGVGNVSFQSAESPTFSVTAPVPATITVANIADAPLVPGQAFEVNYTKTGTFAAANVFSAILSDAAGSFASPRIIGGVLSTTDGQINAVIPADVPAGTGYKVGVTATAPAALSNETAAFTINAPTAPVITTGLVSPLLIVAGSTASVSFATGGTFSGGNVFTAQLSDASGSFSNPVNIGSGASPITATIPVATPGGSNYRIRVVGSAPATTGTDNGANLTVLSNSTANLPIVINKYQNNGAADNIELLVVQNNFDARGYIIKDFSNNMINDNGGKYQFSTAPLWSSLPAGTLIVLRVGSAATTTDVTVNPGASDWNLDISLNNTTYFTNLASSMAMDVAANEIVMIKAPGTGAAGTTGAVHTFANGTGGGSMPSPSNFEQLTQPLLYTSTFTGSANGFFVIATNPTSTLNDFAGTSAVVTAGPATFGLPNNTTNSIYINLLRGVTTSAEPELSLAQRLSIYPSPAADVLRVAGASTRAGAPAVGTLRLYDLSGRQVGQWPVSRADGVLDEQLNVAALSSGLYLLRLELPQATATWKVVKQ